MVWDSDEDIVMTVNEPKVVEEEKVQPTVTTINKTDDSKTVGAPLGRKLVPTRGGLRPGRGRRGGSRGRAAVEVAAPDVFGGSSGIETGTIDIEKPPQIVRSIRGAWTPRRRQSATAKPDSAYDSGEESNTIAGPSTFTAVTKPRYLRTVGQSRRNAEATSKEDLDQLATSSNTRSKSNSFDVDLHNKENDIGWKKGRFSQDIVKRVFGNSGNIYTTFVNIDDEGLNTQMIDCETYILISPNNHPDCPPPPPDIGKNGFLLDISGAEEIPEIDHDKDFPAFRRDSNSLVYLGNYKLGERKIMAGDDFEGIPQMVRDFWMNKIQNSQWGRDFLVEMGFVGASMVGDFSFKEIEGFFVLAPKKEASTFSREIYNTLLAVVASLSSFDGEQPKLQQALKAVKFSGATLRLAASTQAKSTLQKSSASKRPRIEQPADYSSDEDRMAPESRFNGLPSSTRSKMVLKIEHQLKEKDEGEGDDLYKQNDKELEEDVKGGELGKGKGKGKATVYGSGKVKGKWIHKSEV
ncbi:hypothetical protein RUND412_001638 [Rhizina undulata]